MLSIRPNSQRLADRLGLRQSLILATLLFGQGSVAFAADGVAVSVGATVLSKSNCKFSGTTSAALAFGNIDPSSNLNATASDTLTIRCAGSASTAAYSITRDSGLYDTGVNLNRMKHATLNTFLPYSLTLTPSSGTIAKNVDQIITVSGTITSANFQNANIGAYADTVVITLSP